MFIHYVQCFTCSSIAVIFEVFLEKCMDFATAPGAVTRAGHLI